ncbi:MAG: pseudaminic acid cytidylyltransferase [Sulfurimonas sp.]|jgi:pseudaminic acid cytidylyltransferase
MCNKAVAIIPARGGSKRVPRKNIKEFHGKPLIAYSIEVAIQSNLFDRVIVSTDDEEIASIAKKYGADVPFLRPPELSDDLTMPQDAIDHALEYLDNSGEIYDCYCTIYPTAPLMQVKYLIQGFEKLNNTDAVNVFSATSMPYPIQRSFKINKNNKCEMFWPENYYVRSQDLEEAYHDAGQFYWTNRVRQKKAQSKIVLSDISIPIVLPRYLVQDIDSLEDWQRAELMYEVLKNKEVLLSIKEERLNRLRVRKFFNEKYNIELAEFLKDSVENKEEVIKTIDFINEIEFIHPGLNSLEYIVHPLRVAKIIYQINHDVAIDTLVIALLHNIFEVSEVTEKDFLLLYNYNVLNALKALKVNRMLEKNLEYKEEYYRNIMSKDKGVAIVKAIDKLDNLFLLCLNPSDEIRESYLKEIEAFIYPIVEKYIPTLLEYYKNLVKDCREIGFLDKDKSMKLYNEDYS